MNNKRLLILRVFSVVAILIVVFIVYQILSARRFHVVSTNPGTSNVATVSPFFKINFNKPLDAASLSITSSYKVAASWSVVGKTIDIKLAIPMTAGYKYYIKIDHVSDTQGHVVANKTFTFIPKNIPSQDLPADQQAALLQTQTKKPQNKTAINFIGFSTLLNYGMSSDELDNLQQDFFLFDSSAQKISIDQNSIVPIPHNPNSPSTGDIINFSVHIDSKSYKVSVNYFDLTQARLLLYDASTGAQIFDSANAGYQAAPKN